jgi:hypothetical protein
VKRSAAVPLTLATTLTATALAAACGPREQAEALQCVDKTTNRAVPDSVCARAGVRPGDPNAPAGTTAAAPTHSGGFPLGGVFAWYYGGRIVQGLVSGGSYAPLAGRSYRSPSGFVAGPNAVRGRGGFGGASAGRAGTTRGGFGGTAAGRSGGG